jgi:Tfp pilus assembly protein PilX
MKESRIKNQEYGFTLFIAMIVMSTLLLVSTSMAALAVKSSFIYSAARESQHAFYAADSGMECALYWDVKNPSGYSAFSTSTATDITCNGLTTSVGGTDQSQFFVPLTPSTACAEVYVTKLANGSTIIESSGYNTAYDPMFETCSSLNPRRVQRSVRAVY